MLSRPRQAHPVSCPQPRHWPGGSPTSPIFVLLEQAFEGCACIRYDVDAICSTTPAAVSICLQTPKFDAQQRIQEITDVGVLYFPPTYMQHSQCPCRCVLRGETSSVISNKAENLVCTHCKYSKVFGPCNAGSAGGLLIVVTLRMPLFITCRKNENIHFSCEIDQKVVFGQNSALQAACDT